VRERGLETYTKSFYTSSGRFLLYFGIAFRYRHAVIEKKRGGGRMRW
jgi:hypothetical protein